MKTFRSFEYTHEKELPTGHTNEIRAPEALVEEFLTEYSSPGDRVLDIFAGYGTTLTVAEQLDRIPYGLEYEPERASYIKEQIQHSDNVRQGDVLELDPSWFPACDCCYTSPPFMVQSDHRNPLQNYSGESTYKEYLDDLETAFTRLESVLTSNATVIVDVTNMKFEGRVTPLAWDVAKRVSNVFHFEGETVITWKSTANDGEESFGYGYDHSYCHIFTTGDE
ncbi:site-specific DNA-methyltransferase [Halorussus limi]|uniref:Type II methyltransferase n=1 Tax=Halorussus limi TaxID=2938695 RepID=A0A8U0HVL7_9EURY|nr:DNA methyltransferase [Halorussus limi]UPV74957.1 site-specific DNA-methyltransferase [Halorussus limi]